MSVSGTINARLSMVIVVGVARRLAHGVALQWLASTVVIAIGGCLIFGLPQLDAWGSDHHRASVPPYDFRLRWSLSHKLLERRNWPAFTVASLVGGPLAVGFVSGYSQHPAARRRTFLSSWVLACVWSAIYLGFFRWLLR